MAEGAEEVARLRKELASKVRGYEGKLATLTAINSALQSETEVLRGQLADARQPTSATEEDLEELKEEFAERLGTAERQVAALQDDKDRLRAQLAMASQGSGASEARISEKEQYIAQLLSEGEKLSRRNGELEASTRKLRAQLRDTDSDREKLAVRVGRLEGQLAQQTERAQSAVAHAAEAAHVAASELRRVCEDAEVRISAARQQAAQALAQSEEQTARETAGALSAAIEREAQLKTGLSEATARHEAAAVAWADREAELRSEAMALEARVRELEGVGQALQRNAGDATRPLLRHALALPCLSAGQIESMAAAHSSQQVAARQAEASLRQRVREAESAAALAAEGERAALARVAAAESATAAARAAASSASAVAAEVRARQEAEASRAAMLHAETGELALRVQQEAAASAEARRVQEDEVARLQEQLWDTQGALRAAAARERQLEGQLAEAATAAQQRGGQPAGDGATTPRGQRHHHPSSSNGLHPTQRGTDNDPGSLNLPTPDQMDELLQSISLVAGSPTAHQAAGRRTARMPSDAASAVRLAALEQELESAEAARDAAAEQLVAALAAVKSSQAEAARIPGLQHQVDELQRRFELLLEVLGERNEHVDSLELHIKEMRVVFHEQLGVAADQLHAALKRLEQLGAGDATGSMPRA